MSGALEDVIARLKAYQAQIETYKPKMDELEGYHQVGCLCKLSAMKQENQTDIIVYSVFCFSCWKKRYKNEFIDKKKVFN